jgi:hypothetical protein
MVNSHSTTKEHGNMTTKHRNTDIQARLLADYKELAQLVLDTWLDERSLLARRKAIRKEIKVLQLAQHTNNGSK